MLEILERLQQAGVDVPGSINRFGGNESLYLRFVQRFPADPNFSGLSDAMETGDADKALQFAHTLKGVTGNLGMNDLYKACSAMVRDIREGKTEALDAAFESIRTAYQDILAAIG